MIRSIALNNRVVMYELTRKRVKNINLRIRNDGTVAVSCNSYVSVARIEAFLKGRASFILNAIDKTEVRAKNSSRPVMYECLRRQVYTSCASGGATRYQC